MKDSNGEACTLLNFQTLAFHYHVETIFLKLYFPRMPKVALDIY